MNGHKSRAGFTLLELLVVTVIIGIIVGLSVPRFRASFENIKLENFCLNTAEIIRYARQRSLLSRAAYRLVISKPDMAVWLEKLDTEEPGTESRQREASYSPVKDKMGSRQAVPAGISPEPETIYIPFTPSGEIEKTTLKFKNDCGKEYHIVIEKNFSLIKAEPADNS